MPRNLLLGIWGPRAPKGTRVCTASVVRSPSYHMHVSNSTSVTPDTTFEAMVLTRDEDTDPGPLPWSLRVYTDMAMHNELRRYYPWATLRETNTVELTPHTDHRIGPEEASRCMEWHIRTPSLCCFLWFSVERCTGLWIPWRTTDAPSRPPRLHTPLQGDTVYQPFASVRPWCVLHQCRGAARPPRFVTWLPEAGHGVTVKPISRPQLNAAVLQLRSKKGCHVQVVRTPARNHNRGFVHIVYCTDNMESLNLTQVAQPAWAYGFVGDWHRTVRTFWYAMFAVADHFTPLGADLPNFEPARARLSFCLRPQSRPLSKARPTAVHGEGMMVAATAETSIDTHNRSLYGEATEAREALQGALEGTERIFSRLQESEARHAIVRERLLHEEARVLDLQRQVDEGRACTTALQDLEVRLGKCSGQVANQPPGIQQALADALREVAELRRQQTAAMEAVQQTQPPPDNAQGQLAEALLEIQQLRSGRQRALEALQQALSQSQSQSCSPELQALLGTTLAELRMCKARQERVEAELEK